MTEKFYLEVVTSPADDSDTFYEASIEDGEIKIVGPLPMTQTVRVLLRNKDKVLAEIYKTRGLAYRATLDNSRRIIQFRGACATPIEGEVKYDKLCFKVLALCGYTDPSTDWRIAVYQPIEYDESSTEDGIRYAALFKSLRFDRKPPSIGFERLYGEKIYKDPFIDPAHMHTSIHGKK